ncbi:hypothetical protein DPM19_04685 [Actinomadura craniellae]|uniref:Isochorismatase-like domain-containing protein n=1 Tax=Actinomadura craniellae TaxID=2231787 RepID=A0A365HAU2_9ACTN|nr:isochorismatase family protein [Actinomadura craniellae]RAY16201.1 hypothetical protein DPM19_04685 [Actinomadura craniellae]
MTRHVAGTTPYPWPWHGRLDPAALALLVVTCPQAEGQAEPAGLAAAVRAAGGLVVDVRVRGAGAAPRTRADLAVTAPGWDGFHGSPLDGLLRARGRDLLLLAGAHLETGVHSTLRSANDRGYECLLVHDACAAAEPPLRAGALSTIEMSGGIFGAVGTSAAVITALSSPGGTP